VLVLVLLMMLVGIHLGQGHRCKQTDHRQSRQRRSHGQSIDEFPFTMQPPVGGESSGYLPLSSATVKRAVKRMR
jgi:hypothetical protein